MTRNLGARPVPRRIRLVRLVPALDFGGVESELVVQASLYDRTRFDLRVCTFSRPGRAADAIRSAGIEVDVLGVSPSVKNPSAALALAKYVRKMRPDVLHSSIPEADFHASLVGRLAGAGRVIVDEAGMPARTAGRRLVFAMLHRRVDGHVAVSRALRDYLVRREFVREREVFLIPSCGAPEFFRSPKTSHETAGRRFRVVTVGRFVPVKNKAVLVEAISLLKKCGVEVDLVLLGDGPLRKDLEADVLARGVGDRVQIAGFANDLLGELRAADAYVLPSLSEGCSLSLIEAMAMALPVIASRVAGNEEVMAELDPAWLVPPTDAEGWARGIATLARLAPEERASLGEKARELAVRRFSPGAYVSALELMYEQVYAGTKRR